MDPDGCREEGGPAAPGVPGAVDSPVPGHQDTCKEDVRGPGRCSAQSSLVSLEWLASGSKRYQEPLHDGRAGPFSRRTWGLPNPQGPPRPPAGRLNSSLACPGGHSPLETLLVDLSTWPKSYLLLPAQPGPGVIGGPRRENEVTGCGRASLSRSCPV